METPEANNEEISEDAVMRLFNQGSFPYEFRKLEIESRTKPPKFITGRNHPYYRSTIDKERSGSKDEVVGLFSDEMEQLHKLCSEPDRNCQRIFVESAMDEIRKKILKLLENGGDEHVSALFTDILPSVVQRWPIVRNAVRSVVTGILRIDPTIIHLMSDRFLAEAAERHEQNFRRTLTGRENIREMEKTNLKEQLRQIVDEKRLPIPQERIERAINDLDMRFVDPLLFRRERTVGQYDHKNMMMKIRMSLPEDERRITILHEAIHALSSLKICIDRKTHQINVVRSGLMFMNRKKKFSRFCWLNEGITEICTLIATKIKDADDPRLKWSYTDERKLIYRLFSKEEITLLIKAYFEDFKETKGEPAWKTFYKQMQAKHGKSFLLDLDEFITRYKFLNGDDGVFAAIAAHEANGENFPSYLKQWLEKNVPKQNQHTIDGGQNRK